MIETFVKAFFSREEVEAVVLSGSRTGLVSDGLSDYDVYIYGERPAMIISGRVMSYSFMTGRLLI